MFFLVSPILYLKMSPPGEHVNDVSDVLSVGQSVSVRLKEVGEITNVKQKAQYLSTKHHPMVLHCLSSSLNLFNFCSPVFSTDVVAVFV